MQGLAAALFKHLDYVAAAAERVASTLQGTAAAAAAESATGIRELATEVMPLLQAAGMALNTLAHEQACNNPTCSKVSGATDIKMVSTFSCVCAGCGVARYCSRACQKQHWKKQHKPVCEALAALLAAAANESGPVVAAAAAAAAYA